MFFNFSVFFFFCFFSCLSSLGFYMPLKYIQSLQDSYTRIDCLFHTIIPLRSLLKMWGRVYFLNKQKIKLWSQCIAQKWDASYAFEMIVLNRENLKKKIKIEMNAEQHFKRVHVPAWFFLLSRCIMHTHIYSLKIFAENVLKMPIYSHSAVHTTTMMSFKKKKTRANAYTRWFDLKMKWNHKNEEKD